MIHQLRLAARALRRAPGFAVAATCALALGTGAATAVFAAADSILFRPLPYAAPERLVAVRHDAPGLRLQNGGLSDGLAAHYRAEARAVDRLGAWFERELSLTDGTRPERVAAAIATPELFATLGVPPARGRWFAAADGDTAAPKAVLLSHALWVRRYGADPTVVGRTIAINRSPAVIVGVMPERFAFPRPETQLWFCDRGVPESAGLTVGGLYYGAVARLRAGVTPADAERDLRRTLGTLGQRFPTLRAEALRESGLAPRVLPLREALVRDVRPTLLVLLAAAAVLLVVAWATAGALVLLRAAARERETAVRRALGARDATLAGAFLAEGALLAAAGGALGLAVAAVAVRLRFGLAVEAAPRLHELAVGPRGVAVALLLTALGAALLGALAHGRAVRPALRGALSAAPGRATAGRRAQRGQRALVGAQVALSCALLVGAALLGRSAWRLLHAPLGFDPRGVTTAEVPLPFGGYRTYDRSASFQLELLRRLRALPGVEGAEAADALPLAPVDAYAERPVRLAGDAAGAGDAEAPATAVLGLATPGYFRAMRTPVVAGRTFAPGDLLGERPAVVVSASLARALVGDAPAVGRVLQVGRRAAPFTVVGVVGDVPGATIEGGPAARVWLPVVDELAGAPAALHERVPLHPNELTVVVRGALPPGALATALRRLVAELDPQVPVGRVAPLEARVAAATARVRVTALLLALTTAASLFLSAVGLYGVVAYATRLRWRELGVRVALGATGADVGRLVLAQGVAVAGVGIVAGLGAALAATRLLRALLYGVAPTDPAAFAGAAVTLLVLALAASWAPARRAARLDPVTVLRAD